MRLSGAARARGGSRKRERSGLSGISPRNSRRVRLEACGREEPDFLCLAKERRQRKATPLPRQLLRFSRFPAGGLWGSCPHARRARSLSRPCGPFPETPAMLGAAKGIGRVAAREVVKKSSRAAPSARSRAASDETYQVDRRGANEHATQRSGRAAGLFTSSERSEVLVALFWQAISARLAVYMHIGYQPQLVKPDLLLPRQPAGVDDEAGPRLD
jgi:hypothetical protein